MTKPTTRGGRRKGAGRPNGRKASSATITLRNKTWARIDAERGLQSRSKYIETKLYGGKGPEFEVVMDHTAKTVHLIPV